MQLENFESRYKANEFQIRQLFSRYNIKQTGLNGIREGYNKIGQPFLIQAVDIINNNAPMSNFTDPTLEDEAYINDVPFDTAEVVKNQKPGRVWGFLDNLLSFGNSAADTIGSFRQNLNGPLPSSQPPASNTKTSNFNFIWIGAGLAMVIILLVLLNKK